VQVKQFVFPLSEALFEKMDAYYNYIAGDMVYDGMMVMWWWYWCWWLVAMLS